MRSVSALLVVLLGGMGAASVVRAQTAAPQDAGAKPNIAGQVNGTYPGSAPRDFGDHTGFVPLFNGRTLDGWDGRPGVWRVENPGPEGVIVGESSREHNAGNTFLVLNTVTAHDFDLKLEIKVEEGGGSGIQYRSSTGIPPGRTANKGEPPLDPRWVMIGPQADFWWPVGERQKAYSGQLYSQNTARGIEVWRGEVDEMRADGRPEVHGTIGDRAALGAVVKDGEWNQYEIIARGPVILQILNGQLMAVLVDDDPKSSNNAAGKFGLQIEGIPCKVSFRNLWLKKLD